MTETESQLASAVRELKASIEKLRSELVRKDVYEVERDSVREDVKDIKDTLRWLSRTLVASLLMPLISSVVVVYVIQQGSIR